ncbi:MAG: PEP-CTERM sorting domain-containing protein [Akkermansiaceae bacterium]|nr:PEP-CTERM sorting domain-containing protein [Akkermansiaceae bacterium]
MKNTHSMKTRNTLLTAAACFLLTPAAATAATTVVDYDFTDGTHTIGSLASDGWTFNNVSTIDTTNGLYVTDSSTSWTPSAAFSFGDVGAGTMTWTAFANGSTNIYGSLYLRDGTTNLISLSYDRASTALVDGTRINGDTDGTGNATWNDAGSGDQFTPSTNTTTPGVWTLSWDAAGDWDLSMTVSTTTIFTKSGNWGAGKAPDNVRFAAGFDGATNRNLYVEGITVTAVPEPSTTALLGLGGLALILRRRKG